MLGVVTGGHTVRQTNRPFRGHELTLSQTFRFNRDLAVEDDAWEPM